MIPVFKPLGRRPTIISQLHISMVYCNKGLNFQLGLEGVESINHKSFRIFQPKTGRKSEPWSFWSAPRFELSIVLAKRIDRGSVDKNGLIVLSNLKSL